MTSPIDKKGDTRIEVRTYGDGRQEFTPQIYSIGFSPIFGDTSNYIWEPLVEYSDETIRIGTYRPFSIPGNVIPRVYPVGAPTTLEKAQAVIDKYLEQRRKSTVVLTEHVKYP